MIDLPFFIQYCHYHTMSHDNTVSCQLLDDDETKIFKEKK